MRFFKLRLFSLPCEEEALSLLLDLEEFPLLFPFPIPPPAAVGSTLLLDLAIQVTNFLTKVKGTFLFLIGALADGWLTEIELSVKSSRRSSNSSSGGVTESSSLALGSPGSSASSSLDEFFIYNF